MKWKDFHFDHNLTRCLDRAHLNQVQLSLAVGVDESTVSKWMKGENVPPMETIFAIATQLNVHPRALLFGEYEPMDEEEYEIVYSWRRITDGERACFVTLFKEMAKARKEPLKKFRVPPSTVELAHAYQSLDAIRMEQVNEIKELKSKLSKRAMPVVVATESEPSPEPAKAIRAVRLALQDIRVATQVDSEVHQIAKRACTELDHQFAALLSSKDLDEHSSSTASAESHAPKYATAATRPAILPNPSP